MYAIVLIENFIVKKLFFYALSIILIDVEVGLVPLNRSVSENETFQICAEITTGLLGCNITVPLVVEEGSALGEENSNFMDYY